jgi:hypothetical protein
MAQRYRKPIEKRTIVTTTDDINLVESYDMVQPKKIVNEVRRDKDEVKQPSVTLYDVDSAVKYYIEKVIKPYIVENNEKVYVPLFYAYGEKWASIQKYGYMRDDKSKMIAPAMSFKRTSVAPNTDYKKPNIRHNDVSKITYLKQYSKTNYYDNFSVLENQTDKREIYQIEMPEYVIVNYDIQVWTRFNIHTNSIVERLIHFEGDAFGDPNSYKFVTTSDSYTFDTVNATGEDRLSTANMSLTTKAYLLPESMENRETIKRNLTIGKIKITESV